MLLEPVVTLTVTVPDEFMGDIIGDLNSRGQCWAPNPRGRGQQIIRAHVPMAEVLRYAPDLRSMTQGRATSRSSWHTTRRSRPTSPTR